MYYSFFSFQSCYELALFSTCLKALGTWNKNIGINVLSGKILIQNNTIVLAKHSNKTSSQDLEFEPEEIINAFHISKNILQKIEIREIMLSAIISSDDPAFSCLAKTTLEQLFVQTLCFLAEAKHIKKAKQVCFAGFGKHKLIACVKTKIWISVYDVVSTLIESKIQELKLKKGEKHEAN